jgi:Proprotein convertase P-domain
MQPRPVGGLVAAAAVCGVALGLAPAPALAGYTTFQYEVGPVRIPDGHRSARLDFHFIAPPGASVTAIRPNFRVKHRRTRQLRLFVKGPDGTRVLLSDHETHGRNLGAGACGADPDGPSFTGFYDDALVSLADGSPPYSGYYLPHHPLTVFNGETYAGHWSVIIKDTNRRGRPGRLLCGLMSIFYI